MFGPGFRDYGVRSGRRGRKVTVELPLSCLGCVLSDVSRKTRHGIGMELEFKAFVALKLEKLCRRFRLIVTGCRASRIHAGCRSSRCCPSCLSLGGSGCAALFAWVLRLGVTELETLYLALQIMTSVLARPSASTCRCFS